MYGNPEPDFTVPFKRVTIEGGATLDIERVTIEGGATLDIEVDVYLPVSTGDSASLSNAVLYIHGGAMVAMDKTDIPLFLPRYAKSNHLVLISTNYRLAPQGKVQQAASDCIDASKWCESDLQRAIDEHASTLTSSAFRPQWSGKLAVVGGSAGGWLTLLVAAAGVPSIKAVAAIYPMTNLSDPHFENVRGKSKHSLQFEHCCAGDTTIPPTNSQNMAESLEKSKVEHVLRLVPEKAHFFDMLAPQEAEEELGITELLTFLVEQMNK
ncbi:Arylacetamide deacetylase [Ceraceosorus bombacis]|uniref:Arylacetamide deacetylase n=1 Tax=Ceraceosorus bombacis TaxID=401625 RepID=A0A0P1BCW5_9BASI|nr:Arylacetamide deacetylase [Ceraceosorus bombacis]